jgi:diguanylate cyclase (GGDEF)-like protein
VDWPEELDIFLEATRALLWITSPADAKKIVTGVIVDLGGVVLPAESAGIGALPVDVSFGDGEPVVPQAPPDGIARILLERHLPLLVQAVRRVLETGSHVERLVEEASIDPLTRLPNRRTLGRALGRLRAGDVVIMIDLDHFKHVNDTFGHAAGDEVLRVLGVVLRETVREGDAVGRFGGEEFVVILRDQSDPQAFLERLRGVWEGSRPRPVTFSAGIARVGAEPSVTLQEADRAMYRAKEAGRDRWTWAVDTDRGDKDPSHSESVVPSPRGAFVVFSELEVGEGGRERVEAAFGLRPGAVVNWPGFRHLEVWENASSPTRFSMVSWWDSADAFKEYMRSEDHHRSNWRTSSGELGSTPLEVCRFRVLST